MRYIENFSLEDFLQEREDRVERQRELMEKFGATLLVVRSNYPGKNKSQYPSLEIVEAVSQEVEKILHEKILHQDMQETLEGKIYTLVVDMELYEVK
ncbi:MAG: citrate lyase holo-[acyl-carrier protein] synthase, partial [Fusobacteriaceae bacterium]